MDMVIRIRLDGKLTRLAPENETRIMAVGHVDACPILTVTSDGKGHYVRDAGGFQARDVTHLWRQL